MEALILIGLIFFFGIGFIFEVLGFILRVLFSGFGLILGLAGAALLALISVPLLVGLLGFVIPRGIFILGIVFLIAAVINQSHKQKKDQRYGSWKQSYYH